MLWTIWTLAAFSTSTVASVTQRRIVCFYPQTTMNVHVKRKDGLLQHRYMRVVQPILQAPVWRKLWAAALYWGAKAFSKAV